MGSDNSDEEDRERILAPDDLDITAQPEVEEIDEGRYVVSPDGPAKKPDRELLENPDWLDDDDEETAPQPNDTPPQDPQAEQSTPHQSESTSQSSRRTQQPPGSDQPAGANQQSHNTQSGGGGQQSPNPQSGGPNQQSSGRSQQSSNTQSGGRSQQSPNAQSGGRGQQSPNKQSEGRGQQSTNPQSGGPNQQSTNGEPATQSSKLAAHDQPPVEPPAVELTNANVSKFLAEELTQGGDNYGFDATVNVEGEVNRGRMTSDDIGETLETLLRWYARQTTEEVEPESVLGIILAGSDLAVEYPVQSVYTVVKRHGLTPDDSIGDLLAAVRKEGSFTVPPSDE